MTEIPLSIIGAAEAAWAAYRVPVSAQLAQWILESGRGAHMPPESNNPFGIKAGADQPFVLTTTHEEQNGRYLLVQARFRKFPSIAAAFLCHAELLSTDSRYAAAMAACADPIAFVAHLQGVYATDENYASKLINVMRADNLFAHDRKLGAPPAAAAA